MMLCSEFQLEKEDKRVVNQGPDSGPWISNKQIRIEPSPIKGRNVRGWILHACFSSALDPTASGKEEKAGSRCTVCTCTASLRALTVKFSTRANPEIHRIALMYHRNRRRNKRENFELDRAGNRRRGHGAYLQLWTTSIPRAGTR